MSSFNVGDKVSFTLCVRTRHGFSIRSRDGRIAEIRNDTAIVIYRAERYEVPVSDLRHFGKTTALTEAFSNKGDCDE